MIRLVVCILLFLSSLLPLKANAAKVVLLSSFEMKAWEKLTYQRMTNKFQAHFKNDDVEIVVKHKASGWDLWQTLQDPEVKALFWISHGVPSSPLTNPKIVTYDGHDVSPLFSTLSPHLHFLALVGCYSGQISSKLETQNQNLTVIGFDHKMSPVGGLKEALHLWEESKNNADPSIQLENSTNKTLLSVTRTSKEGKIAPPTWIQINGKILGMLPECQVGEVQKKDFEIDLNEIGKINKIIVSEGKLIELTKENTSLGEFKFQIEAAADKKWNVFADRNGKAIGVSENIYRLQTDLE
ncbi:MAG: hypothetical protein ACOYL6_17850 [Bacteriovoracaceae bacterium]